MENNFNFQNQAGPFWERIFSQFTSGADREAIAAEFARRFADNEGNEQGNAWSGPQTGARDLPHRGPPQPADSETPPAPPGSDDPAEPTPPQPDHPHHGPRHCHPGGPPHHGPHHGGPWQRGGCRGRGGFGGRGWGHGFRGHGPFGGMPHGRRGDGPPPVPLEALAGMFGVNNEQVNAFKDFLSQQFGVHLDRDAGNATRKDEDFTPQCDVFDSADAYLVHVSLPGAKKEDVGVNWDADKFELNVAGVMYRPADEETLKTLALTERAVGAFERKLKLGSPGSSTTVDADAITAKMEDGVLIVRVPKVEEFVEVKKVDIE